MHERKTIQLILAFLGWLILTYAAAGIGAIASAQAGSFYAELVRPSWAPPAGWFDPVWTVLYGFMAVAAWLVWRVPSSARGRAPLLLFVTQFGVNALWSWFFFGWRMGGAAMVDILILLVLIIATLVAFWRVNRLAGILMLPYLAWVTFAAALNWAIWQANPTLL